MGAGLRLWRIEHKFGLAALLADGIVVIHDDRSIRIPIRCDANAEDQEIQAEDERGGGQQDENREDEHSSQAYTERRRGTGIH